MEDKWLDIMKGWAPSKTKVETTNNSLRAIDVGALTTLVTFGPNRWDKHDDGDKCGPTGILWGNH
jgi:hypothetical protein